MPELATDPRFLTTIDRASNQGILKTILEEKFRQESVDYWIDTFNRVGVPHARINSYSEALADPQVQHMEWVRSISLPGGAQARTFASPLQINGMSLPIRANPPALGEHTDSVRAALASTRSEEHTSELQSLMRISYAVFCLKKKNKYRKQNK